MDLPNMATTTNRLGMDYQPISLVNKFDNDSEQICEWQSCIVRLAAVAHKKWTTYLTVNPTFDELRRPLMSQ